MALNKKEIDQLKKDVIEINRLYRLIGKDTVFPMPDGKETLRDFTLIQGALSSAENSMKELADEAKRSAESTRNIKDEVDELFSGLNAVSNEIKNGRQGFDLTKKAVQSLTGTMGKVKDIQDDIVQANSNDLAKLQAKALAERKNLEEAQSLLQTHENIGDKTSKEYIALQNINGLLEDQQGLFSGIESTMEAIVEQEDKVQQTMGLLGTATEGVSKGMDKAGLGAVTQRIGLDDALSSTRALVEAGGGNVTKMEAAGHMAGQLGKNLMKSLGPIALIAMAVNELIDAFKMIDGASGEIAKNFGISAAEGQKMVGAANDAATASGDLLVSTKDVIAAQQAINANMGTSVQIGGELSAEFASVAERTGLSENAMAMFGKKAIIAGGSIKDQLADVTAVTMEMSAQSGVMLNAKDIQEGLAEMSAAQMLTAKGNTKEMSRQVFQAKLLGVSQSQLESMGGSLLDFESSIAAEMEAELLTGKQLNLEGARAAALAGDQVKLAEELRKEVGTAAEFGAMNVIQQEAMAKAFGMQREDMAKMLVEQQKLDAVKKAGFKSMSDAQTQYNQALKDGNLSEELKKDLTDAGVLAQMESATMADKFAAAQDKIKDLFVAIMDPLMPILSLLTDTLTQALLPMMPVLKAIGTILGSAIGPILKTIFIPVNLAVDALKQFGALFSDMLPEGTELGNVFETIGFVIGEIISVGLLPFQFVIRTIISSLEGMFKIFGGIKKMFTGDFFGGLKDVFGGLLDMFLSPFQAVFDIIVAGINKITGLLSMIPGIAIPTLPSPKISEMVGLAEGGIVTEPTTALIGEGGESEAVIPLSKLDSMLGGESDKTNSLTKPSGSGNIIEAVSGMMGTIGSMFEGGSVIDKVANIATAPLRGIMDTVGSVFGSESLGDILKNPLEGITNLFGGNNIVDTMANAVTGPMRGVMDLVGGVFGNENLGDIIKNPLEGITDAAVGMFGGNNIVDTIANAVSSPMRGVMDLVGGVFGNENLGDTIKNPLEGITDTVSGLFSGSSLMDTMVNAITAPMDGIRGAVDSVFGDKSLEDIIKNPLEGIEIVDTIANAISTPMRGVMDMVGGIFGEEDLGDMFKNPLESIVSTVSGVLGDKNSPSTEIGALTSNEISEISPPEIINQIPTQELSRMEGELLTGKQLNKELQQSPPTGEKKESNAEMVSLLKELIGTVKQGGDVYIDGAKAGRSMALATSRIG